ncbi:MAG: hypothetical protein ACE5MM_10745 [Nitrospiraceae bacterium]
MTRSSAGRNLSFRVGQGTLRRPALPALVARDLTQALYVAAVALGRTRDADEVVRVAIAETQRAASVEAVALYRLDPGRTLLILEEFAGTTPAFRERMATLPLSEAYLAASVLQEQRVAGIPVDLSLLKSRPSRFCCAFRTDRVI